MCRHSRQQGHKLREGVLSGKTQSNHRQYLWSIKRAPGCVHVGEETAKLVENLARAAFVSAFAWTQDWRVQCFGSPQHHQESIFWFEDVRAMVKILSNNVVDDVPESSSCPNPQQEYCPGCRQPPPLVRWTDHCLLLMVHFFRIKFKSLKHFDLRQPHHLCQSWIWRRPPWWRSWCYDYGSRRSRCCRVSLLPRSEVQQTGDHRNHGNQTLSTPWKVFFL